MLSRLLDAHDAMPGGRALWLVLAAVISVQLLAFYLVCTEQVRTAEARRAEVQASQLAQRSQTPPATAPAGRHYADHTVPAAYVLR